MDNPIIRRIDKGSRIPYYYQLGEILKEEIELGRWAPGELVLSEAGLAELFAVSRTVIRKALDMLEADGAVVRIKGKGTVVAEPKFRYEAVAAAGEWSRGALAGESRLGRVVDIRTVPAGADVARVLSAAPDAQVFELTVVQSVADEAASFSQIYLRRDATPALGAVRPGDPGREVLPGRRRSRRASSAGFGPWTATRVVPGGPQDQPGYRIRGGTHRRAASFSCLFAELGGSRYRRRAVSFTRAIVRADYFRFSVGIHYPPRRPAARTPWV